MKKISVGAQSIIHPNPVLIVGTFNNNGIPNIMNVAWGGICSSEPPCISISMREATQTFHNIKRRKAFTINIPSIEFVKEADYVGMYSGKDQDKFETTKLTPIKSELVDAPYVKEFPYSLECKLIKTVELGLHTMFIGEIVDIKANENILNDKNLPDIEKVRPLIFGSFGSSNYYGIGEKVGRTFSIGKELK